MKIKNFKTKLLITFILVCFVGILYLLKTACPIRALTGIICPGCGMTRAVISCLKLDFKSAFEYHRMFWSLPILYVFFLNDGNFFNKKTLNYVLLFIIMAGFVANWLTNLLTNTPV